MKNDFNVDEKELIKKINKINKNIQKYGISSVGGNSLSLSTPELITGYSYGEFYDWDLYFENIYMSYFGISKYCRNNVEAFLDRQLECGFVARTLVEPRWRQHFKPFLAQTVLLGIKQGQNILWAKDKYYERLKKYLDYWFWFSDFDRNGLCVWDSADHSGMDNQILRAGKIFSQVCEGVDLNCYLHRELKAMSVIASLLDQEEDAKQFEQQGEDLKNKINDCLWDEEEGFYFDRNERSGELIKVKSASSFTILWAGIAPEDRAKRMIEEHLLNPDEFWLTYPIASWAKNEIGYYQQRTSVECTWMGASWVPINYMVMHGLMNYGYSKQAEELAEKTFSMVFNEDEVREYYNGETGIGQGLNPFWGWSALGLFMVYELNHQYNPTELNSNPTKKLAQLQFHMDF